MNIEWLKVCMLPTALLEQSRLDAEIRELHQEKLELEKLEDSNYAKILLARVQNRLQELIW